MLLTTTSWMDDLDAKRRLNQLSSFTFYIHDTTSYYHAFSAGCCVTFLNPIGRDSFFGFLIKFEFVFHIEFQIKVTLY